MTRQLDKELLTEALDKAALHEVEAWATQVGLDTEMFFEIIAGFAAVQIEVNPMAAIWLSNEENLAWLISALSATFVMGWYARALQKGDKY